MIWKMSGKHTIIHFSDISKVEIGKKGQISIYISNQKITTVDPLSDNYDCFTKTLTDFGLIADDDRRD